MKIKIPKGFRILSNPKRGDFRYSFMLGRFLKYIPESETPKIYIRRIKRKSP